MILLWYDCKKSIQSTIFNKNISRIIYGSTMGFCALWIRFSSLVPHMWLQQQFKEHLLTHVRIYTNFCHLIFITTNHDLYSFLPIQCLPVFALARLLGCCFVLASLSGLVYSFTLLIISATSLCTAQAALWKWCWYFIIIIILVIIVVLKKNCVVNAL